MHYLKTILCAFYLGVFCGFALCASDGAGSSKPSSDGIAARNATNPYKIKGIQEGVKLRGKIGLVSPIPDPKAAPYKDCLFAAEYYPVEKEFTKTILLFLGFENRKIIPKSLEIKQGISIEAKVIPFDDLPEDIQVYEQSNDLDDFDSEVYYVLDFEVIEDLKQTRQIIRKSAVTIIPPEPDANADKLRDLRIKTEKERIEKLIADHDGIEKWRKNELYLKMRQEWDLGGTEPKRQQKVNGVLFSWSRSMVSNFRAPLPENNAIEGLAALNDFLKKNGIHLLVLMWPYPHEVSADLFFPETVKKDEYLDTLRVHLMQEFLSHDIEIIDLLPKLQEKRFQYPPLLFQDHLNDLHPASGAARIAGEEMANILNRYIPNNSTIPPSDLFSLVEIPMAKNREYESYTETAVKKGNDLLSFDDHSDFLIAGDSFSYHPQLSSSVGAFCSYYLQQQVALHARSAGASAVFRTLLQAQQSKGILNRKKAVVLSVIPSCFINRQWEIPQGYPEFKSGTFELDRTFFRQTDFEGVNVKISGTQFDFPQIDWESLKNKDEKICFHLPDTEKEGNGFLQIRTDYHSAFDMIFSESDHPDTPYRCGGGGSNYNAPDEITIPFASGKNMALSFPSSLRINEITVFRQIEE